MTKQDTDIFVQLLPLPNRFVIPSLNRTLRRQGLDKLAEFLSILGRHVDKLVPIAELEMSCSDHGIRPQGLLIQPQGHGDFRAYRERKHGFDVASTQTDFRG
jgi:hypothetical protein